MHGRARRAVGELVDLGEVVALLAARAGPLRRERERHARGGRGRHLQRPADLRGSRRRAPRQRRPPAPRRPKPKLLSCARRDSNPSEHRDVYWSVALERLQSSLGVDLAQRAVLGVEDEAADVVARGQLAGSTRRRARLCAQRRPRRRRRRRAARSAARRRRPAPRRTRPPRRRAGRSRRASRRRSPRCPSSRCEALSERIASSVTSPPALRMMCASPRSRPSMGKRSMRVSMQDSTATLRRGRGLRPGRGQLVGARGGVLQHLVGVLGHVGADRKGPLSLDDRRTVTPDGLAPPRARVAGGFEGCWLVWLACWVGLMAPGAPWHRRPRFGLRSPPGHGAAVSLGVSCRTSPRRLPGPGYVRPTHPRPLIDADSEVRVALCPQSSHRPTRIPETPGIGARMAPPRPATATLIAIRSEKQQPPSPHHTNKRPLGWRHHEEPSHTTPGGTRPTPSHTHRRPPAPTRAPHRRPISIAGPGSERRDGCGDEAVERDRRFAVGGDGGVDLRPHLPGRSRRRGWRGGRCWCGRGRSGGAGSAG